MKKGIELFVVEPHAEIISPEIMGLTPSKFMNHSLELIEVCGRVSHKSDNRIKNNSAIPFVKKIAINYGHESILEHAQLTVCFVGSRSMSHQLVRHRLAAYTQESQRYCDYSSSKSKANRLNVIIPPKIGDVMPGCIIKMVDDVIHIWHPTQPVVDYLKKRTPLYIYLRNALNAYEGYLTLRDKGIPSEDARELLPNCTKTEVYTTFNFRQWRHFYRMRLDKHAQWQIKKVAREVFDFFKEFCPLILENLRDHSGEELK
jgi:thymidylate synthase (FAD)